VDADLTVMVVAALGLLGTGGGAVISYKAAKATAGEETERLRLQFHEDERRERKATYSRLLSLLQRLDTYGTGFPAGEEDFKAATVEYNLLSGEVVLFGDERVIVALHPITATVSQIGNEMARIEGSTPEQWKAAYARHRASLVTGQGRLAEAMRRDVAVESNDGDT
jgi:hypothetical protein